MEERKKDGSIYMEKTYTDQHTMQVKKACKNNSVLRKEKESEPKRDCSVEETEAISASFVLAECLCHPPVKAQTKQINRQTVWSTDCG